MIDIEEIKSLALDGDLYAVQELITRLEAAEKDAAKWHEYQAKKKVLADRGFGKSPMRAMKEVEK